MKRSLSILILATLAFIGCTPEDQPGATQTGFDVNLEIPAEITIETDTKTIGFNIIDGKAPKPSDMIILDGPAGQKFCKIKSTSGGVATVELYSGFKEGTHKVSIQRNLDVKYLGSTRIAYKVYDDGVRPENGSSVYGKVSCEGKGIEGVVVSDGVEVAVTDKDGVYQLVSKKKHGYVFVSVPSGYEVPINIVFPQMHKYLSKSASVAERADFELNAVSGQNNFKMLMFGDMHMARRFNDIEQFAFFLDDVKNFVQSEGGNIYGQTLGDMTWDKHWVPNNYGLPEYKEEMKPLSGLTIFQTPGNHDHDMWESGDFDTMAKFKTYIGPSYYSYNIGKVHFVVIDDIECTNPGAGGGSSHKNNIVQEQLDWLKKDLSHVSKDTPIIVSMHIQMFSDPGTGSTPNYAIVASSASAFEDILDDYNTVHIFTAHTHRLYNVDNTLTKNSIYEHNAGAVCACWWVTGIYNIEANIASDGVPGGYTVVTVKDKNISWQYKGTQYPISKQFHSYDRNKINLDRTVLLPNIKADQAQEWDARVNTWSGASSDNEVYINVWNYDYNWKVEVTENGTPLTVSKVWDYDPLHMLAYTYERFRHGEDAGHITGKCFHLFKVKASAPNTTLEIKVTDRFGNVYTESMKRPKEFKTSEYTWSKMKQ